MRCKMFEDELQTCLLSTITIKTLYFYSDFAK